MERIQIISNHILKETEKIITGKGEEIKLLILGILSNGHILIDDIPGVGKTTLAKTLSLVLGCEFRRIQFVADLMPGDVLGMNIFNQKTGQFEVRQGPVHTNILLADEINRATARTQSALLEAMEERQTTIDGKSYVLPRPFLVIATENPIESENTFRLPIAQLDRFMLCVCLGYPDKQHELRMLTDTGDSIDFSRVRAVTDAAEILKLQAQINNVHVSQGMLSYIVDLVRATRETPEIMLGASPRATKSLYKAAKTKAAMEGRDYVTPDDVQYAAVPVLRHRLLLRTPARMAGQNSTDVLLDIVKNTEIRKDEKTLLY